MLFNDRMKTIEDIRRRNLADLALAYGGSAKLSKVIGKSQSQVSQWLNASLNSATGRPRAVSSDSCRQIEEATGRHPGWMDTDHSDDPSHKRSPVDKELARIAYSNLPTMSEIPVVKIKVNATRSDFDREQESDQRRPLVMGVRHSWMTSHGVSAQQLAAMQVVDDSMQSSLHKGDMVLIDTLDIEPKDGDVFVVEYEGQILIRRIVRDAGEWWLSSDNPDQRRYSRKLFDVRTGLIFGKAILKETDRI